jgi:Asp-tRNA(Asn)/Glu-tRNA(Gln) amidotransferase A subunit family amidase
MLDPGVADHLRDAAEALCHETGMVLVDHSIQIPNLAAQWMMGNLATLLADLQTEWPKCAPLLTEELATGIRMSTAMYNLHTAAVAEKRRVQANEAMAEAFDQFDLLLCATNPGPAFDAEASMSATDTGFVGRAQNSRAAKYAFRGSMGLIGAMATFAPKSPNAIMDYATEKFPELTSMGALTMISNLCGNPAVSIPCGTIGGLPVGVQVCASHHADKLLFDVALAYERMDPWPLVAPSVADCY